MAAPKPAAQLPSDERLLLRLVRNHAETKETLKKLGLNSDLALFEQKVGDVARSWFRLAREQLLDAELGKQNGRIRLTYSRAYYAMYNASKAIRYLVIGTVSLRGDDHGKASTDLPDDFPDVAMWSARVTSLYEHRLRADYDNYADTASEHSITIEDSYKTAAEFIAVCETYIKNKLGVIL